MLADRTRAEGRVRAAAADPERSLHLLRLATDEAPDEPSLWLMRAQTAAEWGETDEALTCLDRASLLLPDAVPPFLLRAQILASAGRLEEARAALQEAVGIDPEDPDVLWLQAVLAHRSGDTAAAVEAADRLVKVADNSADPLAICASRLLAALVLPPQAEQRAKRLVREAVAQRPEIVLTSLRGLVAVGLDPSRLDRLAPVEPSVAQALLLVAAEAGRAGPAAASRLAEERFESDPAAPGAHLLLLLAAGGWLDAGEPEAAWKALRRVLAERPDDLEALDLLVRLRSEAPDVVDAGEFRAALERAIAASPRLKPRLERWASLPR